MCQISYTDFPAGGRFTLRDFKGKRWMFISISFTFKPLKDVKCFLVSVDLNWWQASQIWVHKRGWHCAAARNYVYVCQACFARTGASSPSVATHRVRISLEDSIVCIVLVDSSRSEEGRSELSIRRSENAMRSFRVNLNHSDVEFLQATNV